MHGLPLLLFFLQKCSHVLWQPYEFFQDRGHIFTFSPFYFFPRKSHKNAWFTIGLIVSKKWFLFCRGRHPCDCDCGLVFVEGLVRVIEVGFFLRKPLPVWLRSVAFLQRPLPMWLKPSFNFAETFTHSIEVGFIFAEGLAKVIGAWSHFCRMSCPCDWSFSHFCRPNYPFDWGGS